MVSFTNQPHGQGRSVPDALISARFAYWFEVKTAHNAVTAKQLGEHLVNLTDERGQDRLFVITPDPTALKFPELCPISGDSTL
jgi:hypothetical protein